MDGVISISSTTKNDILQFYDFPENKIRVIPLAQNQITDSSKKEIDLKSHKLGKITSRIFQTCPKDTTKR